MKKIKLTQEHSDILKQQGTVIVTGGNTYRTLPLWYKDTEVEGVYIELVPGNLPKELATSIKFADPPTLRPTIDGICVPIIPTTPESFDGKKLCWAEMDEVGQMPKDDLKFFRENGFSEAWKAQNNILSAEEFINLHFSGLEKDVWYPAFVAIAQGYAGYLINQNKEPK